MIKIATMFMKATFNDTKKDKRIKKLCIKNESISVFLEITKIADFRRENADLNKTQKICHVIFIFFR